MVCELAIIWLKKEKKKGFWLSSTEPYAAVWKGSGIIPCLQLHGNIYWQCGPYVVPCYFYILQPWILLHFSHFVQLFHTYLNN